MKYKDENCARLKRKIKKRRGRLFTGYEKPLIVTVLHFQLYMLQFSGKAKSLSFSLEIFKVVRNQESLDKI